MGTYEPAPNNSGFIAKLVRALLTVVSQGHRFINPVEVLNFFSGFFMQLHKLHSQLRGSFFIYPRSTILMLGAVQKSIIT